MPDLPEEIQDSPTVRAIYAAYEKKAEKPRRYLGASVVGKACDRALWYDFRWCGREEFSGRMLRLFQTGHLEELRFAHDLRSIGCEVHTTDPATGQQFEIVALGGHFRGHMDGCALGVPEAPKTWHLLEMKTHNAKSFGMLKSKGVKEAKPEHFAQMQIYMHLGGLERALYLAVNKDTDELYSERVHYDFNEASRILARARSIIEAKTPPEQIADSAEKYPCKFCDHRFRCFGIAEAAAPFNVNCRTCCYSTPILDEGNAGVWKCEKHSKALSEAEQAAGCEDHLFIPHLLAFEAIEASLEPAGDWIEYVAPDGSKFKNGKQPGHYRSIELTVLPPSQVGRGLVQDAKQTLGATAIAEAPF